MTALPDFLTKPRPRELYLGDNYVVIDFETTSKDTGSALHKDNRIVLATWVRGRGHPRGGNLLGRSDFAWGGDLSGIGRFIEDVEAAALVVAHNAKFELQWLARLGVSTDRLVVYDTMLGEYVRLGNRQGRKDLDSVLARYGVRQKDALVKRLMKAGVDPDDIPRRWLLEYGRWDTEATHTAFREQRKELDGLGLLPVLYTRCLTTVVLADIETNGITPDPERVEDEYQRVYKAVAAAEAELVAATGGINLRSPKQLAAYLYDKLGLDELTDRDGNPDRTEAGGRRTDSDTIARLHGNTDEQRRVLGIFKAFGPLSKRLELLEKLKETCNDTGILYANFNQSVTQTHRLSSSGRKYKIQLQNLPRDYKRLFKARYPDWLVGEADGAQLEFRVAAHLGRDGVAANDIRAKFDVHKFSAVNKFNVALEEVTKEQRQQAKEYTFRPLYGAMGSTPEERRWVKAFRERWQQLYETQKGWTYEVLQHKKLRSESGLIFYWPDTKMSQSGYITNTTSIFNYPVQSFATAEIIPIGLVFMWHRIKLGGYKMMLVNTIHDSIIAELPPDEEDAFRRLAETSLTRDVYAYLSTVYGVHFTVPMGAETKVGTHWSEGKAEEYELDPEAM